MSITSAKSGATGISLALDNNFMEPIASTLLSASANTVTFNDIPQNYKHLQVRAHSLVVTTDQILYMTFNSDLAANYASHLVSGNGGGTGTMNGLASQTNMKIFGQTYGLGTTVPTGTITDILDYTNVNKHKTILSAGGTDRNGTGEIQLTSGLWRSSLAITSIQVFSTANFAANSRFSLYGIKG
jgi:hypothetical protein